jgi:hypothetical protein
MMRPHHAIGVFVDLDRNADLRLRSADKNTWRISTSRCRLGGPFLLQNGHTTVKNVYTSVFWWCMLHAPLETPVHHSWHVAFPHDAAAYDYARMAAEMKAFKTELLRYVMDPSRVWKLGLL